MDDAILYLDTNAFLQLRDLKDLPWSELVPGATRITLVVARTVVEELDRHKTGTSGRRRDRARAALRLIDAASEAEQRSVLLRTEPVEVALSIAPRSRPDWDALGLDPAQADDRIVAAALMHGGAALLSHDSGPRVAARDVGVRAFAPPEDWLLPPERTEDQRKLAEANRRVEALLNARGNVTINFPDTCEEGRVLARRYELPPLDGSVIDRLSDACVAASP